MKKQLFINAFIISALSVIAVLTLNTSSVNAQSADSAERRARQCTDNGGTWDNQSGTCTGLSSCTRTFLGLPTWHRYLDVQRNPDTNACEVVGPTVGSEDPERANRVSLTKAAPRVGLAIIDILLRIAGMVAVLFIIYSGFKMVLSQGDPAKEKEARETAINALIGMVIAMFAIAIVSFIGGRLIP